MKRRIAALLAAAMLAAAAPTLAETMRIGDQAVVKKCKEYIKHRNPNAKIFLICAKTGEGIKEWASWLNDEVREWIDK